MDRFSEIEITHIRVSAKPGAALGEAQRQAMELAVSEWHNVVLSHNGREYRVQCNALIACIEETCKPSNTEGQ